MYWQQYPWQFGVPFCKFRALVSEMSSYTSVLTIVAFSLERYVAICHPLHRYRMSNLRRAVRIIAVLWVVSLLAGLPFAVYTEVHYLDFPPGSGLLAQESAFCNMLVNPYGILEISFLVFFLLPMLVMVAIYARIACKIHSSGRQNLGKRDTNQSGKAIIRMLSAVVIAFFLCWAPFHTQRLLWQHGDKASPYFVVVNEWLYYTSGLFYYLGSTVNPILYNLMSVKYRNAFKATLCGASDPATQPRGFREQSSFKDTSMHNVGDSNGFGNGNGFKWQRGGSGSFRHGRTAVLPRQPQRDLRGHRDQWERRERDQLNGDLPENGEACILEPHWKNEVPDEACACAPDTDLVVMISPSHGRRPKCYTVGKVSRKWPKALPKALLMRVSKKSPSPSATPTTCPEHCDHVETCM